MEWQAKWIWHPNGEKVNQYLDFRKTFEKKANELANYQLRISARTEYVLWVNGRFVGRGPSPCDMEHQYYDSYEIADWLIEGINVIAVTVYYFGEKDIRTRQMQGKAGFLLQLERDESLLLASDESWLVRTSPRYGVKTERISRWGGFKEIYIAEQEDGWEQRQYSTESWVSATSLSSPYGEGSLWPRLIEREIPALKYWIVLAESILRTESNYGSFKDAEVLLDELGRRHATVDASVPGAMPSAVIDFGKEVVGRPVLELTAPQGGVLRLAYGESLELQYVDTFILKPGQNHLQPFGRRACRYLQLTFMAAPETIIINKVQFEMTGYPFEQEASFYCDAPMLNRIFSISSYTTLMNSHDHLEDCPWREKALWVVDAVIMGKVIYSQFGDTALLRKCLLQGARIQNEEGSIPGTGPERNHFLLPDFCAYWILGVSDFWNYTGDIHFVETLWPSMMRVLDWYRKQRDDTGLFANATREGMWCFIDWTDQIDRRDKVTAISLLNYKVLRSMSQMAEQLGKMTESKELTVEADALKEAICQYLWLPEIRLFSDCMDGNELSGHLSLQTNFLAVWCGVMEQDEALQFINEYYFGGKLASVRGAFFQHIVIEVLLQLGLAEKAADIIEGYWGEMVDRGATTWWETFDSDSALCTIPSTYLGNTPTYLWEGVPVSLCHAWGASPAYLIPRIVLGLDLSRAGQGKLELRIPTWEGAEASGEFPTKHGSIRIRFERRNGRISGITEIPKGFEVISPEDYPLQIHFY
ncbi:Bacterial alpha-L-rhamnosidase [Paenibacillus sp. LMG 31461]|uniref:Bacterial alpha-L-rhamnosidase n=1 Tax=Paenibacillus plantarum TaxID=2654975 RepID=A0ABX1XAK9_9BACL|nr:alpha-L-rhamnosidase N-terminal domain-containing protein [Paenibacillus plantarum]NOU65485.1 Bacterial alpha-L-rhamnosidase [Paenibacillus plantarum]